jgi:cytochrome c-type biogenesis protein CcmH
LLQVARCATWTLDESYCSRDCIAPQNGLHFSKLFRNHLGQEENGMTLILTIMTSTAAIFLLAMFLRASDRKGAAMAARDGESYRDQPSAVEEVTGANRIDSDQADPDHAPARVAVQFSFDGKNFAAGVFAGVFVLGLVGLLTLSDRPDPSSGGGPIRSARGPETSAVEQLAAATFGPDADGQPQSPLQAHLGTVDEMIGGLVERLNRNPKDAQGWRTLGWSYFNTERFAQSAAAYGKAIALNPENAELRSARGEALVRAADGRVTDEATADFGQALRLDAKDPRGRFFLGLAKEQAGNKMAALDDWIAILNDADPSEAWVGDLMQRVTELAQETGVDVSARLRRPRPAAIERQPAPAVTAPGPSAEDVRNSEAMKPADRLAMVQGMVDRLAGRLEQSPRDVEGWIKLMRSRQVLGETEGAEQTFRLALDVFKDAPREQEQISTAARALGLMK